MGIGTKQDQNSTRWIILKCFAMFFTLVTLDQSMCMCILFVKGAETNLYTFRYWLFSESIHIYFCTLYSLFCNQLFCRLKLKDRLSYPQHLAFNSESQKLYSCAVDFYCQTND